MIKILIIRFSSIGDIVLTTPVVRCIKKQLPDAVIHYITKTQYAQVLEANPYIDKLITIKKDISEVLSDLKSENYDHVIDLHKNLRSFRLRLALGKPVTSFNKLNKKKWLLVNLKINLLPKVHIVDRYLKAAEKFGVVNDGQGLDYFIPANDEVDTTALPAPFNTGYVGFVIGAKQFTKQAPPAKVVSLCQNIQKPVILIGGPEDKLNGDDIQNALGANVYNACGAYSINQSASLIRKARMIITNDTGMMHIAAALRKPIVSLWGNTIPKFGMYPYYPKGMEHLSTIAEVNFLSCRPCSKLGFKRCPRGHFNCMMQIDEALVAQKANSL
jgi:ADP-heptose:LPS heptosyltransferase